MFKNVASQHIQALVLEDDNTTPFTGTVTVLVSKDGAATAAGGGTVTNRSNGLYDYAPTQAETNANQVSFLFSGTGATSVVAQVYTAPVTPDVNVTQISGDSTAADNLETAADGGAFNLGGGAVVAASVTAGVSLADNAITAAKIASDAITAAKIATDAITAAKIATDAISEIQSGLSTVTTAQVLTQVNTALSTVIADSVAADGSRPTIFQALLMMTRFLMEKSVSGTVLTVKKEDGATSSMTFTLNDADDPTSITRAS